VRELAARGAKFYAVGALGIVVQLAALAMFKDGLGLPYLWATALAVEVAVVHNFLWHDRWTWRDRAGGWGAFVRFNLTTGLVSIAANLVLMRLLVGTAGLHHLWANLVAVAVASVANFLAAEFVAFRLRSSPPPSRPRCPAIRASSIRTS
jgi:putative flippase GtrA